jgi:hypothetical protein
MAFVASVALVLAVGSFAACESMSEEQREQIEEQNDAADKSLPPLDSGSDNGERSVFDLREGDCIGSAPDGYIETVAAVPCSSAGATNRVTKLFMVDVDGPYPGDAYFDEQYYLYCDENATYYLWPSEDSWAAGDRTVICLEDV